MGADVGQLSVKSGTKSRGSEIQSPSPYSKCRFYPRVNVGYLAGVYRFDDRQVHAAVGYCEFMFDSLDADSLSRGPVPLHAGSAAVIASAEDLSPAVTAFSDRANRNEQHVVCTAPAQTGLLQTRSREPLGAAPLKLACNRVDADDSTAPRFASAEEA